MAAATFIADMCNAVEAGTPPAPKFNKFSCAGTPIPPVVIERAYRLLGMRV